MEAIWSRIKGNQISLLRQCTSDAEEVLRHLRHLRHQMKESSLLEGDHSHGQ